MKSLVKYTAAVVLCGFVSAVSAVEMKIGYVDSEKLIKESPQYAEAQKRLESEFKPRQTDLVAKQKRLKELLDKLKKDGVTMSESERGSLEKDILTRRRQFESDQTALREDSNLRRIQELQKLREKVKEVVQEFAKAESYDVILADGVYFSERLNVTDKILEKLKK